MNQHPRVLRFGINTEGRDYILTDPHGAYDTVVKGLKATPYNRNTDRLFGGGDYIDRGKDSARAAGFLRYVTGAVKGNHEQMLIDLYKDGEPDEAILKYIAQFNGFSWWLTATPDERQAVLAEIRKLPYVIEVETVRGKVGIVHADVPAGMHWDTFVKEIEAGNEEVIHVAIWGRKRVGAIDDHGRPVNGGIPNHDGVEGIGRVFVGHTPQWGGARRYGNVYALDTGAIYGETGREKEGRLTIAELACQTQVLVAKTPNVLVDIRADSPFDTAESDLTKPFGNYVISRNAA